MRHFVWIVLAEMLTVRFLAIWYRARKTREKTVRIQHVRPGGRILLAQRNSLNNDSIHLLCWCKIDGRLDDFLSSWQFEATKVVPLWFSAIICYCGWPESDSNERDINIPA